MKNTKNKKKIEAAAAITAVVLATFIIGAGPAIIADPNPGGPQGSFVGEVTIWLNATDDISGVDYTEYKLYTTGSAPPADFTRYDPLNPPTESRTGSYTVEFRSVDNAGNIEATKTATFSIVDADNTPPVTLIEIDGESSRY